MGNEQAFMASSIPINDRPVSHAATSMEPEPQNGSNTRPPAEQNASMSGLRLPSGFCVGCSLLPAYCHSRDGADRVAAERTITITRGCGKTREMRLAGALCFPA